ncbi:MAG: pantetheine-phosphate adenylyltransferase [Candidatus Lokiarchaeota archaeon]|nr:pantetheine-phosphate adenylyltransferase [Candidatus Lokiarchaeota archaeon]
MHLHDGHKLLLKTAFRLGKHVAIGLVTDEFAKEKEFANLIEPYTVREKNIIKYISSINPEYSNRCTIIPLKDSFGPSITNPDIEIHVSSEETYKVAFEINEIRAQRGLQRMVIVIIPLVLGEDGTRISSTKIRKKLSKL